MNDAAAGYRNSRIRRHIVAECGDAKYGGLAVDALERARVRGGIGDLEPDKAYRLAMDLWLAEEEAEAALKELIDRLKELRYLITNPEEIAPDKDSRSWDCDVSAGEMDRVVHAMRALTAARRAARPAH